MPRRGNANDPRARQALVDQHLPFVRSIAAKVKERLPREIEFDDLVAYGTQGLLEASERFDPSQGVAFTTFAYYRIRGAIYDGLRGMGWIPRGEYARHRVEERANQLMQTLTVRPQDGAADGGAPYNRDANDDRADATEQDVRAIATALGGVATVFVTSLDAVPELVDDPGSAPVPHRFAERRESHRVVRAAIDTLPDKERRLLEMYYYEDRSLEESGRALGLSKSWASRLHARAILLLKRALEPSGYAPPPGPAPASDGAADDSPTESKPAPGSPAKAAPRGFLRRRST